MVQKFHPRTSFGRADFQLCVADVMFMQQVLHFFLPKLANFW